MRGGVSIHVYEEQEQTVVMVVDNFSVSLDSPNGSGLFY